MINREIDVKVAEKIFGYKVEHWTQEKYKDCDPSCDYVTGWVIINEPGSIMYWRALPHYSVNIADAWTVLEKMLVRQEEEYYSKHFEFDGPRFKPSFHYLTNEGYPLGTICWFVKLCYDDLIQFVCADTASLAICLAALKANDVETKS